MADEKSSASSDLSPASEVEKGRVQKVLDIVNWTPPWCRYTPEHQPEFTTGLNILFAFAGCFTVANLYYSHPILNKLAVDFDVIYERASVIPTVMQAGYAGGLLLLCPIGDLVRRRQMVLWVVFLTATLWIGLCITNNFETFAALSFLAGFMTVTPQVMLPLVGDLAPPKHRATALSIVVSGMLLGMLVARVLSGVVTQFIGWRYIYWIALGLQYLIFILLWLFMPDYPAKVQKDRSYIKLILSIFKIVVQQPTLVQACLVGFLTATIFTDYWTTLTGLLAGSPYGYNSLEIGCFAFIGIVAMTTGPIFSRLFIDKHVPLISVIIGECVCLVGAIIGTFVSTHSIAGPVIEAFAIDVGLQTSQIANRTAIYQLDRKQINRMNSAYMVSVFCGQLVGTAVGNKLYAQYGWEASAGFGIGTIGLALCVCFAKGPHEKGWGGWRGGWNLARDDLHPLDPDPASLKDEEKNPAATTGTAQSSQSLNKRSHEEGGIAVEKEA
jgi:predicted MFS family arabinose efflux permease